jgi:hypothetical protein
MAKLIISRSKDWTNKARKIGVYLDGQKLGAVSYYETVEYDIPAGPHQIKAKIDWCESQDYPISIAEGETKAVVLSSYKYSKEIRLFGFGIILLHLFLRSTMKINFVIFLALPLFLLTIYYLTIGRKHYLRFSDNWMK